MLADARAPAVLAVAPAAVMLTQMPAPPQSFQMLLRRLCWQMPAPPQSLQLLLWRLCSHFLPILAGAPTTLGLCRSLSPSLASLCSAPSRSSVCCSRSQFFDFAPAADCFLTAEAVCDANIVP